MRPDTTRRAMLGALAATPLLAASSIPIAAPRRSWDVAVAEVRRLEAEANTVCDTYSAAEAKFIDDCRTIPDGGRFFVGDTAESFNLRMDREKEERREAEAAFRLKHNVDRLEALSDASANAAADALDALLEMRAPDMEAVAQKIELAHHFGRDAYDLLPAAADARRLAKLEA